MGTLRELLDLIKNGPERDVAESGDERIASLKKTLGAICPFGRRIVDAAEAKGAVFCTDGDLGKRSGVYHPATGYVVLNAKMSDDVLLSSIVHEARHALQPKGYTHEDTVKSAIMLNRAMEADAMAFQCAAVAEMKDAAPGVYREFTALHADMRARYETEYKASNDREKAMSKAFEAWYENAAYVDQYDRGVLDFMAMGAVYRGAYRSERPASEPVEKLKAPNGKSYISSGFLASEKALTVSLSVAERAAEIERKHVRHLLFKPKTTSADRLFVRLPSGEIKKPELPAVSKALKSLRQGGR